MPDIHTIRLRGPWEVALLDTRGQVIAKRRVKLPAAWSKIAEGHVCTLLRGRRKFGKPDGLEPHETVWLALQTTGEFTAIRVNGTSLQFSQPSEASLELEITGDLEPRNELEIEVRPPKDLSVVCDDDDAWHAELQIRGVEYD